MRRILNVDIIWARLVRVDRYMLYGIFAIHVLLLKAIIRLLFIELCYCVLYIYLVQQVDPDKCIDYA